MIRILVTVILVAVILLIFGAKDAAYSVLDWGLTITKWIFIIGAIILIGILIFSRKK